MSMPKSYPQMLREAAVSRNDLTPQDKADGLNLLEAIFSDEFDVNTLVDKIANGTVPKVYEVKK